MSWADPGLLWLLALVPALAVAAWAARHRQHGLRLSTAHDLADLQTPLSRLAPWGLKALRLGAIACFIVALARPLSGYTVRDEHQMGVDIMLALDISGSMRAEDFQPENRLTAAKQVLGDFIAKSQGNRVGLVIFAGQPLTIAPLTTDLAMLRSSLDRVTFDSVREDGTAIGDAIGTCLYRLKQGNAKGKVIVLFTDGENNAGYLSPMQAAAMARVKGVRIHTIAVGRPGGAPIPLTNMLGQKVYLRDSAGNLILPQIDEGTLKQISAVTGGRYFRATDTNALRQIYAEINRLEKSPITVKNRVLYNERYRPWLLAGLVLVLAELLLANRRWRVLQAS